MRHPLVLRLASLKLSVGLLVAIIVALATGTLVESTRGAEAARAVYGAWWFYALLGVFAVNLAAALASRWPWTGARTGFALTHGAMLVILLGALTTEALKTEGRLALWEGEQGSSFVLAGGDGSARGELPFSVRLDAFEIDFYPGTRRPAMYRSRVTVFDPGAAGFPAVIEMNRELSHRGWRLFQSSFQQAAGREMTVLSVSRDPGQPVVFVGYTLLMIGMVTVLVTRIRQRRQMAGTKRPPAVAGEVTRRAAAALAAAVGLLAAVGPAAAAELPDPATVEALRPMPVQHDGRAMPLDTLAREAVWKVTGRRSWNGADPLATVLGWAFDPGGWAAEPMVRVGSAELAAVAGLPAGTSHASLRQLAGSPALIDLLRRAGAAAEAEAPLAPLDEDVLELEQRLVWAQRFFTRDALRLVPVPGDPQAVWGVPPGVGEAADLIAVFRAQQLGTAGHYPLIGDMLDEVRYNAVRPARLAWWILVPAALLAVAAWLRPRRWLDLLAAAGLVAGFAVMTWGIAARWQVAGRIPASNMYESMLFLGWGVGLFALVAALVLRQRLLLVNATAMAALAMVLVDRLPMDPFVHPMPPVLSGTPWLAIHVPIIMVSYSVLALGVLVAHMQLGLAIVAPARRAAAARMNDLLYWYMHIGAILLVVGILTGSIWAASSWGRYWGWDPKEVWSLIAFLAYMAILHGRFDRFLGPFGVAAASIVAFWAILMTYIGVNFVLAAGLHSYGFGSSGVVRWMALLAAAETLFLGAAWWANRRRSAPAPAAV